MSTVSKAIPITSEENISQGDVFRNIRYSYIDNEDNEGIEIVEYVFPMAIIISQACDVGFMGEMVVSGSGKPTKFMPSILLCPIYDSAVAKAAEHLEKVFEDMNLRKEGTSPLYNSCEYNLTKNDWHYRYHALTVELNGNSVLEDYLIDFKHYFTVPATYLLQKREDRLFRLDDLYSEQITLKFATFLTRVAIP